MGKRVKLLIIVFFILLIGCETKKISFIITEDGKKQYKNEEGIFVKDNWIELNGDKYYFDKNGYLVTNDWVQEEYFVDSDGKMKKDFWYNDGKSDDYYYLGNDGKFVRDDIVDIGDKSYAFDKNGLWIKNKIFISPKDKEKTLLSDKNGVIVKNEGEYEVNDKKYYVDTLGKIVCQSWKKVDGKNAYYNESGERVYNGFALTEESVLSTDSETQKWYFLDEKGDIVKDDYIDYDGENYCADENGILLANQWKEYDGKKYYYGPNCNLVKNQIVDYYYYVDETGAMVTNKEITIGGEIFAFGSDGKCSIKNVNNSNSSSYAKKSSEIYTIRKYTNSIKNYIENKKGFQVFENDFIGELKTSYTSGKAYIIADEKSIRFRIRYDTLDEKGDGNYTSYIKVSSENNGWDKYRGNILSFNSVYWGNGNKYIELAYEDAVKFLEAMKNNDKLYVSIESYYDFIDASKIYKFMIDSSGFFELYNTLI